MNRRHEARARDYVFGALAVAFGFGALLHLAALVRPAIDPESPPWRHALFVAINLVCVAGFRSRPWYFLPAYVALAVQQGTTHGASVVEHAQRGEIAWSDVAVMLVFGLGIGTLGWEQIERRRAAAERRATRGAGSEGAGGPVSGPPEE